MAADDKRDERAQAAGKTSIAIIRHQITELPPARPVVIETQIHELECPTCQTLQRGCPPEGAEDQSGTIARKLHGRYVKHQDHLLYFLRHPDVPPTNNACEQALRPSVIHRKVTNGFRSEWSAKAYAALETVIDTAKLKGRKAFEALGELMGKPVLPFLDTPAP